MSTLIEQLSACDERQFDVHLYNAALLLDVARRRLVGLNNIRRTLEEERSRLENMRRTHEKERNAMMSQVMALKLKLAAKEARRDGAATLRDPDPTQGDAPGQSGAADDVKDAKDAKGMNRRLLYQRRGRRVESLRIDPAAQGTKA